MDPNFQSSGSEFDVIVIGGGPAGLSACLLLGRACRNVALIDAGDPRNARARKLNGFITRDGTDPQALLQEARRELNKYCIHFIQDTVVSADCCADSDRNGPGTMFSVDTQGGLRLRARKLLFATGMYDELPAIPGIDECYGSTVHHCPYCDGWEHRNQRLVAYGDTTSSAIGLGLLLKGWSPDVTVLTHGRRLSDQDWRRVSQHGLACCEGRIRRLIHQEGRLQSVEFESGELLEADALFFNTSQTLKCDLPRRLGCKGETTFETGSKQTTQAPGVFVAGDADGEVQFVIVAAAEGATAAVTINRELQEEDRARASDSFQFQGASQPVGTR